MKNRTLIGIICIVLALVVAFGIAPVFSRVSDKKITVYRAATAIASGHQLTEADLTAVTVSAKTAVTGAITDSAVIIGMYTVSDMFAGDTFTPEKLTDTYDGTDDIYMKLDGSQVAVSITISSFAGGLSGKLKNGDIVSFIVSESGEEAVMPEALQYVLIITTTTSKGLDNTELVQKEDGTYELPSTVTVLVTPEQARQLAQYENRGKLHVSLVYRGDEAVARNFLDKQMVILAELEAKAALETEEGDGNG